MTWREVAGRNLTDSVVQELLAGRATKVLEGFRSQAGEALSTRLRLDEWHRVVFELGRFPAS